MGEIAFLHGSRKSIKMIGTPCLVTDPDTKYSIPKASGSEEFFMTALWDTGATQSAISRGIVEHLGLQPTGRKETIIGSNGEYESDIYEIDLHLSKDIVFKNLPVSEMKHETELRAIVGLDVILRSDFAIIPEGYRFQLRMRYPGEGNLDFTSKPIDLYETDNQ